VDCSGVLEHYGGHRYNTAPPTRRPLAGKLGSL
jgi:hypothetical protein